MSRSRLADLDLWKASKVHELAALFSYLDLPDAFIAERLNSVTHSFGFFETEGGAECKSFRLQNH